MTRAKTYPEFFHPTIRRPVQTEATVATPGVKVTIGKPSGHGRYAADAGHVGGFAAEWAAKRGQS